MRRGVAPQRRWRSQTGAELLEFALVSPLLLLILFGIVDFGFLFQRYEVVTNAAREGARIGVLSGYTTSDVQARVNQYISAAGLPGTATTTVSNVTLSTGPGKPTFNAIRVRVEYPHSFAFVAPFAAMFGGSLGTINITSVSVMRKEEQAAGAP